MYELRVCIQKSLEELRVCIQKELRRTKSMYTKKT
jgi:hypothetical protein